MSNSTLQLALEIALQTKNLKELDLLMEELKAAGVDVSNLTDESAKLAKQFAELEQKQSLINQFRELKKATSEANAEWRAAQDATAAYTSQIQDAKDSLEALEVAMRNQGDMSQEEARTTQAEYNAMVREIRNLEQAQANQATRASQLSTQYDDLNSQLVQTRSAMHDVGLSTTGLNAQQQALTRESEQAQAALGELTAEAERLNAIAQARVTLGIDTDDNARRQIEEVTAAYETLRDSGTLTAEELARANELHTQRVAELEVQLGETAPTLETLAEEFGKVTAAAGGLAYVTNAAMEFETAMSGVKKVVDGTPEQIQALSAQIQQMSIDMGMGTDAIAEIAAQGGQLGIPIEKLGEFTKMAGEMSVAFGMTAEDAGDAAAKIANVFGLPIEEVGKLGDAINTLGNTSAAKESEIVDVMQRIGGQAKQFGLATEQAAALSAAFISLGKSPEVAGTAINALLTKLQTANVQSDDFKEALAGIGLNADKMADDIAANPQQALSNFLQTLESMDKQQRSVATFKLFGQEYVDDVNALVGGLDTYNKALDSVKDKSAIAGAMQKEFNAKMDTSAQSIDQAKQSINVLAQTVGKELLPVVSLGAKAVGGIAQAVTSFAENFPLLTKFAVLIASAQVSMVALNSVMTLAGAIGLRSGGQIAAGFLGGTAAIDGATAAATRFNAVNYAGFIGGLKEIAKQFGGIAIAAVAGYEVGNWAYESSKAVRVLGDHLASIPAAIHSIITTGSLDGFVQNFEMGTAATQETKKATDELKNSTVELMNKQEEQKRQDQEITDAKQKLNTEYNILEKSLSINTQRLAEMKANGQENTAAYKDLSNEINNTKDRLAELKPEQDKNIEATKSQSDVSRQLINDIKITEASLEAMKNRLAEMETAGQKNTQGYKDLSDEIGQTTDKLDLLNAEAKNKGFSELLKTDLDKTAESFKALGLDVDEFATGVDGKATAALNGFVDVAHLADGDIRKLALAYNAAKDAAGDNQLAQDALNQKLLQVTAGNTELAQSIKITADAQRNAKNASSDHVDALSKLGESLTAAQSLGVDVDKVMNKVGDTFEQNTQAVRQVAAGYTELQNKGINAGDLLYASLNKVLEGAKSQKEIQAVQQMYEEYGKQGKISTDQVTAALDQTHKKTLEIEQSINGVTTAYKTLGIASQAELTKKAADYKQAYDQIAKDATASEAIKQQAYEKYAQAAIDANNGVLTSEVKTQAAARGYAEVVVENGKISTKTAEEIAQANKKSEESHKKVTQSTKEQGDAAKEAAEKGKQAAENQEKSNSGILNAIAKMYDNFTGSIAKGLQNVGVSGEQSIQIMKNALRGQAYMMTSWTGFFQGFANAREHVKASIDAFNEVRNSAIGMTQTLGSATVTTNDLGMAQLVLNRATTSTVDGIVKMDNATLDNLKRQIDSTKQKFDDLSKSAKDTADGLQTQLARLKGDDTTARQLEQTKKLAELQERVNEARKRGNTEEIAQLQRAFDLQKQINDEENRQASVKQQQEQQAKKAEAQKQDQMNSSYNQSAKSTSSNTQSVDAKDVANSFADLIEKAKKEGANELAQQLMNEAKRLAR